MSGTFALIGLVVIVALWMLVVIARSVGLLPARRKVDDVGSSYGSGGGETSITADCGDGGGGGGD